jgi:hypothetical protein
MLTLVAGLALFLRLCLAQGLNFNQTWNLTTVLGGQAQLTQLTEYLQLYPDLFTTLSDANVTSTSCPTYTMIPLISNSTGTFERRLVEIHRGRWSFNQ